MPLYAATIFLSAFLLFLVQPMVAKMILPWFGGTAAVWTTCLLFFQVGLLAGYLYAHWSIRHLPSARQGLLHIVLLAISLIVLPIAPGEGWKPQDTATPTTLILWLLLVMVGLPYVLLSTTGPLLQAWYARRVPPHRDMSTVAVSDMEQHARQQVFPYRLYALSNVGSMLALLGYPVLVEPYLTIRQQSLAWSAGYATFVLLCAMVAWQARSLRDLTHGATQREENAEQSSGPKPTWVLHLYWLVLAACASTLLLAVSNHLTQNVAAIPFLWVLPLSLYLLSFILCFGGKTWLWEKPFLPAVALAIAVMANALSSNFREQNLHILVLLFSCGLFICCVLCHGELARTKPDPRYLTSFYLMVSLGGALGGVFVGLLAPHIFNDYYELPLAIAACAVVAWFALYRGESGRRWSPSWLALGTLSLGLLALLADDIQRQNSSYLLVLRNFYGVLRISQWGDETTDDGRRSLIHGTTVHGAQFLKPNHRMRPTTYYGPESGVGLAIRESHKRKPGRVGVIGLGTGTIASYGRAADVYRFYDINPLVVRLANTQFSFITNCKARVEVVSGDARLSLEREPKQNYDVLVVDAFSSDAIPVHLLTIEAFKVYFRHLKSSGVLAVHVSNWYLNLEPVVQRVAQALDKQAMLISNESDEDNDIFASNWVLVTARRGLFQDPLLKQASQPIEARPDSRAWTDDYSNLYQVLR